MNVGDMQGALPDDAFCVTRNDEIWFPAALLPAPPPIKPHGRRFGSDIVTQEMKNVVAWNVTTKRWRSIRPMPKEIGGNAAWHGLYDATRDLFIIPTHASFLLIRGDGQDVSPRFGASLQLQSYGDFDFHASGIVQDGRNAYVYDQKRGALYRFNLDNAPIVLTKVLDLPELTYASAGRGIYMAWHLGLRAVVMSGISGKMYAFEVDSNMLTKWSRPDGFVDGNGNYVSAQSLFYDPDSNDVVSVGGIDWNTGVVSTVYSRMRLSKLVSSARA